MVYFSAFKGLGIEIKAHSSGVHTVADMHLRNVKCMSKATNLPRGDLKNLVSLFCLIVVEMVDSEDHTEQAEESLLNSLIFNKHI